MAPARPIGVCVSLLAALWTVSQSADRVLAADWPNWRGPTHNGIITEKGFKTTWTDPPKVWWEYPVGSAFSAFACVGSRAFTCGTKDRQQVLFCFGVDTGKVIWEKPFEKELRERQGGDGTRATPTVHEGRVYIFGAHGLLLCVKAESGEEVWRRQFHHKPQWAYSGSVLIEDNLAIVSPGGSDGALVALDSKTGQPVWTCGREPAGYATPYPFTFAGKRYVVGFMAQSALIADAKTGRQVCSIPWKTDWDVNASAPIYHDGHLFFSTGYGTGCALFKLGTEGEKLSLRLVWKSKVLLTKFTSCVLKDGFLYAGDQNALKCVEFASGRPCWVDRNFPNASVLVSDEHLIVFSEDGRLMIAKATPNEFKPTAQVGLLSGRCWTIPTLANGKLFVRNLEKAVCIDLSAGS